MNITCAPSIETFKSRLIDDISSVVSPPKPSQPSMQAWVQEDSPCRHSEIYRRCINGDGFKKKKK